MANDHATPREGSSEVPDNLSSSHPQQRELQQGDQLAQLTMEYLDVINGSPGTLPQLDTLASDQRALVLAAWGVVDQLLVSEPLPELDTDPTAIALGATPAVLLDPNALRQARQRRELRPSDLAASLRARGWPTKTADIFVWERRPENIAPALLADLAATLGTSNKSLILTERDATEVGAAGNEDAAQSFLQAINSDELDEVVQQWAQLFGLGLSVARQDLQRKLSNAAHRGQRNLTPDQWRAVVRVLLASERARHGLPDNPVADE